MLAILYALGMFVADLFKSRTRLEAENLFLRYQLTLALRQKPPHIRLRGSDWALLVWMVRLWPSLLHTVAQWLAVLHGDGIGPFDSTHDDNPSSKAQSRGRARQILTYRMAAMFGLALTARVLTSGRVLGGCLFRPGCTLSFATEPYLPRGSG